MEKDLVTTAVNTILEMLNANEVLSITGCMQLKHGLPRYTDLKHMQILNVHIEGIHELTFVKEKTYWELQGNVTITNAEYALKALNLSIQDMQYPTVVGMKDVVQIMTMMKNRTDDESKSNDHSRWNDIHFWLIHGSTVFHPDVQMLIERFNDLVGEDIQSISTYLNAQHATKVMERFYEHAQLFSRMDKSLTPLEADFNNEPGFSV